MGICLIWNRISPRRKPVPHLPGDPFHPPGPGRGPPARSTATPSSRASCAGGRCAPIPLAPLCLPTTHHLHPFQHLSAPRRKPRLGFPLGHPPSVSRSGMEHLGNRPPPPAAQDVFFAILPLSLSFETAPWLGQSAMREAGPSPCSLPGERWSAL